MRRALLGMAVFATLSAPGGSLAQGELTQRGNLRVSFTGKISPHALPRQGTAPIAVSIGGRIATTDGSQPPALQTLQIAINRAGRLDYRGLPACKLSQIQPSTTANALAACGPAPTAGRPPPRLTGHAPSAPQARLGPGAPRGATPSRS